MARLTTAQRDAFEGGLTHVAQLAELNFASGVERWAGATHDIVYEGETYTGVGNLGSISDLETGEELVARGLRLELNLPMIDGAPSPAFEALNASDYKGREARIFIVFFESDFATPIYSIEQRYSMDQLNYSVDPKAGSAIELNIESELYAKGRRSLKRYTDEQQRSDYPGDVFFQYLSYLSSGVNVLWGTGGAFYR